MKPSQESFLKELEKSLELVRSQSDVIETVSQKIYASFKKGGVVHVFGSGHSHSFAEELFHRAGGLVPVNAWLEEYLMPHAGPNQVGPLERLSGLPPVLFKKYQPQRGEVLILASNSGINAATVELAQKAKAEGLTTVGVTSLTHSKSVASRAGQKLFEVVDYAIDTGTPVGDACVSLKHTNVKVGPLSGVVSLAVAQLFAVRIAEIFDENAEEAPVYKSANTPGGDERNKALEDQYRSRIRLLR